MAFLSFLNAEVVVAQLRIETEKQQTANNIKCKKLLNVTKLITSPDTYYCRSTFYNDCVTGRYEQ